MPSTTGARTHLLARVPLFSGLSRRHLSHVAAAEEHISREGTTLAAADVAIALLQGMARRTRTILDTPSS